VPRRTVTKCTRRAAAELAQTDELCIARGHCFGVSGWERPLASRAEFVRLWRRWGDEITERWIDAYPGSRPLAAYVLGEIPAPAWTHELPALREPVTLERVVVIEDRGWHRQEIEVDHLADLGVIDDDEHDRAILRLESPDAACHRRYRPIAAS
jgi:hypothetical protein